MQTIGNFWKEKLGHVRKSGSQLTDIEVANNASEQAANEFFQNIKEQLDDMISASVERGDEYACFRTKLFYVDTPSYRSFVSWLAEEDIEVGALGVEPDTGDVVMTIYPG